ncbi:hypothetical protein, partial [Spirosoma sp.]|uniref:hypothetical protein n=1 Tax=Spirosoma sp. TaxID=1899569 RepID=UPI003B3B9E97
PEMLLHDFAEITLAGTLVNYQMGVPAPALPAFAVKVDWSDRLQQILSETDNFKRIRRLIHLAGEVFPESAAKSAQLTDRLDRFEDSILVSKALDRSNELLRKGNYQEALEALTEHGLYGAPGFAIQRQRAFLLLKLERIAEADELVALIKDSEEPAVKQFVERYQSLKAKVQLQIAQQHLRKGEYRPALDTLLVIETVPQEDTLEMVYCKALAYWLEGYDLLNRNDTTKGLQSFQRAHNEIEANIRAARAANHEGLLELYEKTTQELDKHG